MVPWSERIFASTRLIRLGCWPQRAPCCVPSGHTTKSAHVQSTFNLVLMVQKKLKGVFFINASGVLSSLVMWDPCLDPRLLINEAPPPGLAAAPDKLYVLSLHIYIAVVFPPYCILMS